MESNVTLRSNVYINKSSRRNDPDFVHHLRDYSSLSKYYNPVTAQVKSPSLQFSVKSLRMAPQSVR